MVQAVGESGRKFNPGQVADLPHAKALEWERLGFCRIVQPKQQERKAKKNELVA